jgi:IS1 family transposase
MNQLNLEKRAKIIHHLVKGSSMRATSRLEDCSFNTVAKLLVDVGTACASFQDSTLINLPSHRIQCDEIWSFCYSKEKNVSPERQGQLEYGDVYTWTSICADTKLVPSFLVGRRDAEYANAFIEDLSHRLANRVQLTTDGYKCYLEAVEEAFQGDIDYAMLVKLYGAPVHRKKEQYLGADRHIRIVADNKHILTSYVERQNLTMRMSMRKFTRKTNGFSKKIENLEHAVALYFMYYNFARIHKILRVTPAMEAGISNHVWEIEDIINLI